MSVIDFYGIASDSKGNILPNKKVCISDIDTSVVLQTTSTDAKGRFKFTVDDAGNYDIYRGTTIKTPVTQKARVWELPDPSYPESPLFDIAPIF